MILYQNYTNLKNMYFFLLFLIMTIISQHEYFNYTKKYIIERIYTKIKSSSFITIEYNIIF